MDGRIVFRLRLLARPEWELDARLRLPDGRATSALIAANTAMTTMATVARSGRDPDALARTLISSGLGTLEAYKIAELAGGTTGFAHFGAARTRKLDRRRRAGHMVSVYDTTAGRYLVTRNASGGQRWVTVVPGTPAALIRQLDELLTELT